MNNSKYLLHLFCLFIIQIAILDNIQLHSFIHINIYILAILIIPYKIKKVSILFTAFLLGLILDIANNTMGIHTAAATFVAYIRPKMLQLTSNREQVDDIPGTSQNKSFGWFLKYMFLSVLAFNVELILAEAFSFANFSVTLLRILCSTVVSCFFILLYYFIALKKKQE